MSFFKWGRKKETEPDENEPVLAAVIKNPVTSEIFQDILKENGIRLYAVRTARAAL